MRASWGYQSGMTETARGTLQRSSVYSPWVLLGVGLGAFVDGIVLHQVLQWHHMVSDTASYPLTTPAGLRTNTVADGVFHVAAWVLVVAAVLWLLRSWRRGAPPPRWGSTIGLLLVGWGLFNVAEASVNHHLLEVHHVRDDLGGPVAWDVGFLACSLLLVLTGVVLHRGTRARSHVPAARGSDVVDVVARGHAQRRVCGGEDA
ncbi:MAG TPA: DUF2243 domain-containing protein [Ornithinibacter sp.]|nr:DUF2243 domain-containing protein [Ornithinibacter sp.]